jgi:hypothetical protein
MNWLKNIFKKTPAKKTGHKHDFRVIYRTGNGLTGMSDVCKCACGQWAVWHRNPACGETQKFIPIEK